MAQLSAITLNDRETTPVGHIFTPNGITNDVGELIRSTGVPLANERMTLSCKRNGKKIRAKVVLTIPVVATETINGVSRPVVVRTSYAEATFTYDDTSTTQERKNLVGMLSAALAAAKPVVEPTIVDLEKVF